MAWTWMVAGWGRQAVLTKPNWAFNFIPITSAIGMLSLPMLVYIFILNIWLSLFVGAVVLYMAHICPWERAACVEDHS